MPKGAVRLVALELMCHIVVHIERKGDGLGD